MLYCKRYVMKRTFAIVIALAMFALLCRGEQTSANNPTAERICIEVAEGVTFDMVYIPEGTFTMGATAEQGSDAADDESPAHRVALSEYYIATTECTQAVWCAIMQWNNSAVKGDNLPVTNVNAFDCREFLDELSARTGYNFRLPTEAEWEYAARGGAASNNTKYSGSANLSEVAWSAINATQARTVAQKKSNELGLYDMSGNVYEICSDEYAPYSADEQTDPQGGSSDQQVFRGGAYISESTDCRTSVRSFAPTDYRDAFIGFRLVMTQ